MDKLLAVVLGALCGVGQFWILRQSMKPLAKGETPRIAAGLLMRLPLPIALLVGCGLYESSLLPYTGAAFCGGLFVASVINHMIQSKKGG